MQNINVNKPVKYLSFGLKYKSGINFTGKRVVKSKGNRKTKRKFRLIDFYRLNYLIPAYVLRIEYDPNRTSSIALICYKNGILSYILSCEGLKPGIVLSQQNFLVGLVQLLKNFKNGTFVSCVELYPGFGSKLIRAAGCYGIILASIGNKIKIRLPSGEIRLLRDTNKAVLGIISNVNNKLKKKKKAGNNIWIGKKPIVRGVAKNCIDHPHGGGRGKTAKLVAPTNFTRRVLKGVPLYSKKNLWFIVRSRKWKKN